MSTEQLILDAEHALRNVADNEYLVFLFAMLMGAVLLLALQYIGERWSFIQRKRQRARFDERFDAPAPDMRSRRPERGTTVTECGYTWTIM